MSYISKTRTFYRMYRLLQLHCKLYRLNGTQRDSSIGITSALCFLGLDDTKNVDK